jgi:single-strand DNA-binding protein
MLNKVFLMGRVGKEPEVKYTPSGSAVANFSMATSEKWKNKDGKQEEKTEWHNIVAWRKLAEICGSYVKKGDLIHIEGKITTRTWEDRDGNKRSTTEIVANELKMLGGKKQQDPAPGGEDDIPF